MKLMVAIIHTTERAKAEEIETWKRFYETIDGMTALVMPSGFSDGYCFCGAGNEESRKSAKEAFWWAEQDEMFGAYVDQREEFDRDWENGDHCFDGCLILEPEMVEIIEEISTKEEAGDGIP